MPNDTGIGLPTFRPGERLGARKLNTIPEYLRRSRVRPGHGGVAGGNNQQTVHRAVGPRSYILHARITDHVTAVDATPLEARAGDIIQFVFTDTADATESSTEPGTTEDTWELTWDSLSDITLNANISGPDLETKLKVLPAMPQNVQCMAFPGRYFVWFPYDEAELYGTRLTVGDGSEITLYKNAIEWWGTREPVQVKSIELGDGEYISAGNRVMAWNQLGALRALPDCRDFTLTGNHPTPDSGANFGP